MVASRITAIWNFHRYDLLNTDVHYYFIFIIHKQWHRLNSTDIMLGSQPFHIMNDGYLFM